MRQAASIDLRVRPDAIVGLADRVLSMDLSTLGESAVEAAEMLMADGIAVMFAGANASGIAALVERFNGWGGRPESQVAGYRSRLPAPVAALLNSAMMHARDFDDNLDRARFHVSATALPAALAVAESEESSGGELLAAYVAGVELACRLADAIPLRAGWHQTSVLGSLGAAAAAGRLLGLDNVALVHALGHAYTMASGTLQGRLDHSLAKRVHVGLACRHGVTAAYLARDGITGAQNVIAGRHGLLRMFAKEADRADLDEIEQELNRDRERTFIEEVSVKPYPCCRACHASIAAVQQLMKRHGLEGRDVDHVELEVPEYVLDLVGKPFGPTGDPEVTAQFSVAYTTWVTLRKGSVRLADFEPTAVLSAGPAEVNNRVRVLELSGYAGQRTLVPARVRLITSGGRRYQTELSTLPGHPEEPLDPALRRAKAEDCLAQVHGADAPSVADRLEKSIRCLSQLDATALREVMSESILSGPLEPRRSISA